MEQYPWERAENEAVEIQKRANQSKEQRDEAGSLKTEDYVNAEKSLESEVNNSHKWNRIYQGNHKEIPWNFEEVPEWFQEIIRSGWVKPGKTLDVGCGLGNYANYLASNGFDVTAVDFSEEAIEANKGKYKTQENLKFKACDALELRSLDDRFDFVLDISLFHHIKPEERKKYAESLASVTEKGAKVLVCCFSQDDEIFEGKRELYGLETDTVMYALSKEEIVETFRDHFDIDELKEFEYGRSTNFKQSGTKKRNLVFMTKQ